MPAILPEAVLEPEDPPNEDPVLLLPPQELWLLPQALPPYPVPYPAPYLFVYTRNANDTFNLFFSAVRPEKTAGQQ